jgi:mRNA interferase RelE/StbE
LNYTVVFSKSAEKEFSKLDLSVAKRIFPRIKALASNPRPMGCIKLSGEIDAWRIRMGDYRVVYVVDDHKIIVEIMRVRHRREVYL